MWLETPIIQIMNDDPVSVGVDEPFSVAYRALSSGVFHHLPVVEEKRLVGILSTLDVLKLSYALLQDESGADDALMDRLYRIEKVMTPDPLSVSDRATLGEAAKALSAGGFHALPVVDLNQHLRGIITSTDLINHMLEQQPAERSGANPDRERLLEDVFDAAQLYLRSGLAETEHSRLERALEKARRIK